MLKYVATVDFGPQIAVILTFIATDNMAKCRRGISRFDGLGQIDFPG